MTLWLVISFCNEEAFPTHLGIEKKRRYIYIVNNKFSLVEIEMLHGGLRSITVG